VWNLGIALIMERHLAAILAADVVGYSRLMEADESGTLARLMAHRNEFIDPTIAAHHGRIVKLMGDGALVEFASVVDALACAVDIQRGMRERNQDQDQPAPQRIEFRIGINLGDVMVQGNDIYGDGVNVAARLEGLAEPGGVCISDSVRTAVGSKLPLEYEFLGEQQVKNIAEPIRAFRAQLQAGAELPEPAEVSEPAKKSRARPAIIGGALAVVVIGVLLAWFKPWAPEFEPASVEQMSYPLPDKPSIAVLPFDNLSGDPEQDYLADGLTEEIISTLSRTPKLFVIARNSTDIYKNKPTPVKEVAEEQGVRYVLEGSVQRVGDRIRINVQLIDALAGDHVWSERYDRDFKDLFALQDNISHNVAIAMQVHLTVGEMAESRRRGTPSPEAFLLAHKALWHLWRFNREDMAKARALIERAREIAPDALFPLQMEGWIDLNEARYGWSPSKEGSMQSAEEIAKKALAMDPNDADTMLLLAGVYRGRRDLDRAARYAERTIELSPNHAGALNMFGHILNYSGRPKEAKTAIKKAMRLSPYSPAAFSANLGLSYMMLGEYDKAIAEYEKVLARGALTVFSYERLAAIHALKGDLETAREYAGKLLEVKPDFTIDGWSKVLFYKNTADLKRELDALRKAGLPETSPLKLPEKPSIAVLPFTNMSGDPEQEYFADGMTDDLITDLSKVSGLFVIARNSTFAYKGQSPDVRQVAKDLGVRYVIEGSVRRARDKVRINAQLIDASTGGHMWAERFDRKLTDVFALQDEVSQKIVSALAVKLTSDEKQRFSQAAQANPEAYDLLLRGLEQFRRFTKETNAEARKLFKRAITHDPDFARAYADVAWTHGLDIQFGWSEPSEDLYAEAFAYAEKALQLDPTLRQVYAALGNLYLTRKQHDKAIDVVRKLVALHPNYADGYAQLGQLLIYAGRPRDGLDALGKAMILNPRYAFFYTWIEGHAHMMLRQHGEAIEAFEQVIEKNAHFPGAHLTLASLYGNLGNIEDAKWEATEVLSLRPDFSLTREKNRVPYKKPADLEYYIAGLRKAGLPD
jgi:adenylate cyclase